MIRRMEERDVEQVGANEAVCFSMPWSTQAFRNLLTKKEAVYLVAEIDGQIVGHCGMLDIAGEGEIMNVAVHPGYRNRKIGQQMLEALLEEGEKAGITAFTLEVRAGNLPAVHMYEKAGFLTEGVRRGFYEKPKEDALIMWKR